MIYDNPYGKRLAIDEYGRIYNIVTDENGWISYVSTGGTVALKENDRKLFIIHKKVNRMIDKAFRAMHLTEREQQGHFINDLPDFRLYIRRCLRKVYSLRYRAEKRAKAVIRSMRPIHENAMMYCY